MKHIYCIYLYGSKHFRIESMTEVLDLPQTLPNRRYVDPKGIWSQILSSVFFRRLLTLNLEMVPVQYQKDARCDPVFFVETAHLKKALSGSAMGASFLVLCALPCVKLDSVRNAQILVNFKLSISRSIDISEHRYLPHKVCDEVPCRRCTGSCHHWFLGEFQ